MTRPAFSPPIAIAIAIATGLALAIATAGYLAHGGWAYEGAAAAARLTARNSFLWFLVAWSASAVARLWPGGWRTALLRRRRSVGLGFAASHTVHLGALLVAILVFDHGTKLVTIVGGGLGYLFVFAMAITSNDAAVRRLGQRRWRLLHATGGYVIAGIFAFSYLGRVKADPWLGVPMMTLIGLAAALRILAWATKRARVRVAVAQG
jgi:DMSO/TMAO reductase YedYZ heme-binding membrane subunit